MSVDNKDISDDGLLDDDMLIIMTKIIMMIKRD